MALTLTGLGVSVYTRIVRMALVEKDLPHGLRHADPFADPPDAGLARLTPFNRVPVLEHGSFAIYETAAILRYLEDAFPSSRLTPYDARSVGRMAQVIGIVDAHGYWPMVRRVFAQRVFAPLEGRAPDEAEVARGLADSATVLAALEAIAEEGLVLDGRPTLADLHLAPMIDYFAMAPEGAALLARHAALSRWFERMRARPCFVASQPDLASPVTSG